MTGAVLRLEERLDLRAAGALAKALAAERGHDLVVDAASVRHAGALAVQVIRSAARSWAEDGNKLRAVHICDDVVDQIDLLGFTPDTLTKWEPQP